MIAGCPANGRAPRQSPSRIDPCAELQAVFGRASCIDVSQQAAYRLVPWQRKILSLKLLHPIFRAVDDGQCRRFLDDWT